jgi:hypothetical protein
MKGVVSKMKCNILELVRSEYRMHYFGTPFQSCDVGSHDGMQYTNTLIFSQNGLQNSKKLSNSLSVKVDYLYGPSPIKAIRASGSLSITLLKHVFQMSRIGEGGVKSMTNITKNKDRKYQCLLRNTTS